MFALFAGIDFYPLGGWNDYKGTYDTQLEAFRRCMNMVCDWWHIVDLSTGEIIEAGSR